MTAPRIVAAAVDSPTVTFPVSPTVNARNLPYRHARRLLSGRAHHHSGDAALIATPAAAGVQSLSVDSAQTPIKDWIPCR